MNTLGPATIIVFLCLYMGLLFIIAEHTERQIKTKGKSLASSPAVYTLSLAVYCTSWTFYGSVGYAVTSGPLFLTIYLGPTLCILLWWTVLRKMVRIKSEHRITSIADFISARYNRSQALAALATIGALLGSMPYVALQLKSIITTFTIISPVHSALALSGENIGPIVVVLMILFTIVFGVRRIDPTERHQGMVMVVAAESLVKLIAFLSVGIFVTYVLFDGFGDVVQRLDLSVFREHLTFSGSGGTSYLRWASFLVLGMSAILFLPRQFHVAVVENSNEKSILSAMWLFPLYMVLINIFVIPIAMGGLLSNMPVEQADTFVLRFPMASGHAGLTLLVFIGGFSAATGMIMISAMTMATMITNHLMLPMIESVRAFNLAKRYMLQCRWGAVAVFILMGYWFEHLVGESYMLVNIGIISFAAALQFAPAILLGIFWRGANKVGAILGMGAGFAVWFYTMLVPALAKSGWLPSGFLFNGLFELGFLRPEAFLGLHGLDPVSHTVFWSMFFNISFLGLGSLIFTQSDEERQVAESFVGALAQKEATPGIWVTKPTIALESKKEKIIDLLMQYFPRQTSITIFKKCVIEAGLEGKRRISVDELARLAGEVERSLAGSFGSAAAHRAVTQHTIYTPEETAALKGIYGELLVKMRVTPQELRDKIDYYQEREKLLKQHGQELEEKIAQRNQEIIERKRVEEALRESEERLKNILDSVQTGVVVIDAENHVIVYVNPVATGLIGLPKEAIIGRICHKFICPSEQGKCPITDLGQTLDKTERTLINAEGKSIPILKTVTTISLHGRKHLIDSFIDITPLKIAEEALRKSEEKFRTLSTELSEGLSDVFEALKEIASGNPDTRIPETSKVELITELKHTVNQTAENLGEIVELSHEFAIGLAEHFDTLDRVSKGDLTARVAGTSKVELLEALKTVTNQMIESVSTEIAERKRAEEEVSMAMKEAESANVAKGQFLANMSHEIRTPMNGVIGFTDMLLDTKLNEEQVGYAETIKRSGEGLLALINDILDFSKIEAGQLDLETVDFDPETTALDVCRLIRLKVADRNVEIFCRVDDKVPSLVNGDPARFRQVLLNLMGNAAKFTDSGEIELFINVGEQDNDRAQIHVTVRDTGIGIPADKLVPIFQMFQQADPSTTRKYGGTGLGLPISRSIANIMGGNVWVESEWGKGSIFHFTAWLKKTDKHEVKGHQPTTLAGEKVYVVHDNKYKPAVATQYAIDNRGKRSARILLAEDNEVNQKLATMMLSKAGHEVEVANNGVEAVQKYLGSPKAFDLIFMDIQMPEMDGIKATKAIRNSEANPDIGGATPETQGADTCPGPSGLSPRRSAMWKHVPIVAMTAHAMKGDREKCLKGGMDDYITKPIKREAVLEMIDKWIFSKA